MTDILRDIYDATDALCDPRRNFEPRHEWTASRNRKPLKPHETTVPGLVQQLRELAEPGSGGSGGGGGGDGVPVSLDAVSLLGSIQVGVRMRARQWGVGARTAVEDYLRGLAGMAGMRDHGEQRLLRSEFRSWQRQAEIVCGWRSPPRELPAPCPQCSARGTLLAQPDVGNPKAWCVGCGACWAEIPERDEGSIRILAAHVIAYERQSLAERKASRTRAVGDRRRRDGEVENRAS